MWEGYADPCYVRAFEESHHCKITAAYMGSSDELVAKLRGGSASNYDVISPSSDVAHRSLLPGLLLRSIFRNCPPTRSFLPACATCRWFDVNGKVYGVPFAWGPNPLLYDTTYFRSSPASWAVLWDPKTERENFRLGRAFHDLHGRAGAWIRQARSRATFTI